MTLGTAIRTRGKLTVFLGIASGAGKTYAMLKAASDQKGRGTNVLIGWMNTVHRETRPLAMEFPWLDRESTRTVVEDISKLKPDLVLIDEMAHSHDTRSSRTKRYQDIDAILGSGIDVYTTLNIQEVESLTDTMVGIVSPRVHETVPDTYLERVDHIQLVDVLPEELITRYKEGRIQLTEDKPLLDQFYRLENLIALREMALRYTALRVDRQLDAFVGTAHAQSPLSVSEKVMVCVSSSPFSAHLIRVARQMADRLKTEWMAIHVDVPRMRPSSVRDQENLMANLQLAEELGGKVVSITGSNIAREVLAQAQEWNVKQIVIGKPKQSRMRALLHGRSVVNEVIQNSHGISVHVIPGRSVQTRRWGVKRTSLQRVQWTPYAIVTILVIALTAVLRAAGLASQSVNIALMYLLPILLSATRWGLGPSFYAAGIGVIIFDFFFVPPFYSFTVADLSYVFTFAVFLGIAFLTASLASRLRQQVTQARSRAEMTSSLYALSREITAVTDVNLALNSIVRHISGTLGTNAAIFLPDASGRLVCVAYNGDIGKQGLSVDGGIAAWVYRHGEAAGRGTMTFRDSLDLYVPLSAEGLVHGVLAIRFAGTEPSVSTEQSRLADAIAGFIAMALARIRIQEDAKKAALMAESEKLHTALLHSISHELRTPLATIIGASTSLVEADEVFSKADRLDLLSTIRDGAMRMDRLVSNLLGMVRLESGSLRMKRDWCDFEDIVGVVTSQVKDALQNRELIVHLDEGLPLLLVDDALLEQVLVNVLSNAIKYSPDGTRILLCAELRDAAVEIRVEDEGMGITPDSAQQIFEKFYRLPTTTHIPGTGLGLAICKGIIELHGGRIEASPRDPNGTLIQISLPLDVQPARSRACLGVSKEERK